MISTFLAKLGRLVLNALAEVGQVFLLLLGILRYVPNIFRDRGLVLEQMKIVGSDSLPLVILIGSFTGAIAALQATDLFEKFNLISLARPFIGGSIATAVFTELTPVLTALVIAGRVGGAIAAQLGTMKVSEQIDALEMMAIDPNRYLGMPRMAAAITMMPILAVFSNVVALTGAFILAMYQFDFNFATFFASVQQYFRVSEIVNGLSKSLIFGGWTALIGCHVGFHTTGGAEGVGNSTVRAFTISAAGILIIDALFGIVV
ncbi:MAG TPA: ABC transporter permease [Chlorobiota bacterium]|nr:ABC transporter permease [Chlorobiota bacterium]